MEKRYVYIYIRTLFEEYIVHVNLLGKYHVTTVETSLEWKCSQSVVRIEEAS